MSQILQYLPFSYYRKFLRSAIDGCMGVGTHVAEVLWEDGICRESFVKFYKHDKKRALLNEAIGFLLIRSLNLPQPELGGFLQYKISETETPELWKEASELEKYRGEVIAWVTTNTNGLNKRIEITQQQDPQIKEYLANQLRESLKKWCHLPELILCDDWLANDDRNLGNLLELPNRTFTLIDHGGILYGDNWTVWDIMQSRIINGPCQKWYTQIYRSKFGEDLFWKQELLNELTELKQKHIIGLNQVKEELFSLIDEFTDSEEVDTKLPRQPIQKVSKVLQDFLEESAIQVSSLEQKCDHWLDTSAQYA
ncbi:hypothetical protein [Acinetobacter sp. YH12140]|uniref:hypothetical protein n=1 Tax=Acinetobacter sp. YH12140 TaxID=2601124 RepID=UPI0015D2A842|nr:hypothetical protein [Acinetobacter sp. YH12140]